MPPDNLSGGQGLPLGFYGVRWDPMGGIPSRRLCDTILQIFCHFLEYRNSKKEVEEESPYSPAYDGYENIAAFSVGCCYC